MALVVLAGFWTAYVIARLDGPFDLFFKLRHRWGAYDYGNDGLPQSSLGKLVSCPYCVGFYTCGLFLLLTFVNHRLIDAVILLFALPGGQMILQGIFNSIGE